MAFTLLRLSILRFALLSCTVPPHLFKSLISSLSFLYLVTNLLALAIKQPNILLVCVDDLRPELGSFGVNYVKSPNIDRLAKEGRPFYRHYAQAPTCGAFSLHSFDGEVWPSSQRSSFRSFRKPSTPQSPSMVQKARIHFRIRWKSISSSRRKRWA